MRGVSIKGLWSLLLSSALKAAQSTRIEEEMARVVKQRKRLENKLSYEKKRHAAVGGRDNQSGASACHLCPLLEKRIRYRTVYVAAFHLCVVVSSSSCCKEQRSRRFAVVVFGRALGWIT